MPNNTVYSVIQDQQGFMWFGTLNGLARYDGYQTRVFKYVKNDPHTIAGNFIWTMALDKSGHIWISSWGNGVSVFDPRSEKFFRYQHHPNDTNSISSNNVWSILEDKTGRIWLATENGLDIIDLNRENIKHISYGDSVFSLKAKVVTSLLEDSSGDIWLGTMGGGISRFDSKLLTFRHYFRDGGSGLEQEELQKKRVIWGLCEGSDGTIWMSGLNGISSLAKGSNQIVDNYIDQRIGYDGSFISRSSIVVDGELWSGGSLGLDILDIKSGKIRNVSADAARSDGVSSKRVWDIFKSRDGIIWLATENGVDYILPNFTGFQQISHVPGAENTLQGNTVTALDEGRQGDIWIGTEQGLDRYDPQSGMITAIKLSWGGSKSNSMGISDIISDQSGNIWVSSMAGVIKYSPNDGSSLLFSRKSELPQRLDTDNVVDMASSSDGGIWIAMKGGGLYQVLPGSDTLTRYRPSIDSEKSFGWITYIQVVRSGEIWIALDGGLSVFDPATDTLRNYQHKEGDEHLIGGAVVKTVLEDSRGRIWMGTDQGIVLVDSNVNIIKHISPDEGLPSNLINSLLEADDGSLWIGSDHGLARFFPDSGRVQRYFFTDVIQTAQFSKGAAIRAGDGTIYFGGSNGLSYFSPQDIKISHRQPQVLFTEFIINNKQAVVDEELTLKEAVNYVHSLTLNYDQNQFSISFTGLEFAAPMLSRYAYRLDGVDRDWVGTDAENRKATYSRLDPGTYLLHVRTTNDEMKWSPNEATLFITILAPWWESVLFKSGIAFLIIFGVFACYVWRVKMLKRRSLYLESQVEKRTNDLQQSNTRYKEMYHLREKERAIAEKSLQAERESVKQNLNFIDMISHEYRTPLYVLSSSLDLLEKKVERAEYFDFTKHVIRMRKSTDRLRDIFEIALDSNRVKEGSFVMDLKEVDLAILLERVVEFTRNSYPDYSIELCSQGMDDFSPIIIADPCLLNVALTNILDNACKYSATSSPIIVTCEMREQVIIKVKDEGDGIRAEELDRIFEKYYRSDRSGRRQGVGVGLFLVKKIVDFHNGVLKVKSTLTVGTIFTIMLPVSGVHEDK